MRSSLLAVITLICFQAHAAENWIKLQPYVYIGTIDFGGDLESENVHIELAPSRLGAEPSPYRIAEFRIGDRDYGRNAVVKEARHNEIKFEIENATFTTDPTFHIEVELTFSEDGVTGSFERWEVEGTDGRSGEAIFDVSDPDVQGQLDLALHRLAYVPVNASGCAKPKGP